MANYENERFDDISFFTSEEEPEGLELTEEETELFEDDDAVIDALNREDRAFTAGINPGGLTTRSNIRILVCYILKSLSTPVQKEIIVNACQLQGLANYYEITDAISNLALMGSVKITTDAQDYEICSIEPKGIAIAESLYVALPPAVRDRAIETTFSLMSEIKRETENSVEIERTANGYNVTCHISGGSSDLMKFTIYVPDLYQARMVKKNFYRDPEKIYKLLLGSITGNRDLQRSFDL